MNQNLIKFLCSLSVSTPETFLEVFEKERAKYLKENEEKLKMERSIAYKLLSRESTTTSLSSQTKTQ